jgi:phosphoglycolate phosphatase-like HAD superfamily hydrolase
MITDGLSAIMFDLDGTLRFSEPRGVDAFHEFAERLGFNASLEQRRRAWRWVYE